MWWNRFWKKALYWFALFVFFFLYILKIHTNHTCVKKYFGLAVYMNNIIQKALTCHKFALLHHWDKIKRLHLQYPIVFYPVILSLKINSRAKTLKINKLKCKDYFSEKRWKSMKYLRSNWGNCAIAQLSTIEIPGKVKITFI